MPDFFAQKRAKRDMMSHLRNSTSDHNFKILKALFNTKYPLKLGENHLRNHFQPLESGFSAIATYKTRIFSKSPNGPILKIEGVVPTTKTIQKIKNPNVVHFSS